MILIGLGNQFRHDDATGLIAARRLRERRVAVAEHDGDPASLVNLWNGADSLIVIDAISSGAAPGTIHCFDLNASTLPQPLFRTSTHALSLADAIELSRTLGTLPTRAFVLGVEGHDFTIGVGLSPDVERALPALLGEVVLWQRKCILDG
jgi:hydrogenase maturation protease